MLAIRFSHVPLSPPLIDCLKAATVSLWALRSQCLWQSWHMIKVCWMTERTAGWRAGWLCHLAGAQVHFRKQKNVMKHLERTVISPPSERGEFGCVWLLCKALRAIGGNVLLLPWITCFVLLLYTMTFLWLQSLPRSPRAFLAVPFLTGLFLATNNTARGPNLIP